VGLMDFLKPADINAGVEEFRATPGARLIDVRTAGEYAGGHIPGAVLLPLGTISEASAASVIGGKDAEVLVYCRSGSRSKQAAAMLARLGYTNIFEFGGIMTWPYEVTAE